MCRSDRFRRVPVARGAESIVSNGSASCRWCRMATTFQPVALTVQSPVHFGSQLLPLAPHNRRFLRDRTTEKKGHLFSCRGFSKPSLVISFPRGDKLNVFKRLRPCSLDMLASPPKTRILSCNGLHFAKPDASACSKKPPPARNGIAHNSSRPSTLCGRTTRS